MVISWLTREQASSVVHYGIDVNTLNLTAIGNSSSYLITYDHHVELKRLTPKTKYYYKVRLAALSNLQQPT